VKSPLVKRAEPASKTKVVHIVPITHRDQVEAPFTDWLREAYAREDLASAAREGVVGAAFRRPKKAPGKGRPK
jgi:hypothetical protein